MPFSTESVETHRKLTVTMSPETQLEVIMRQHNQALFRVARAILRDEGDAEEVVQAAYVAAFSKLEQLSDVSSLGAWLRKITVNRAYDRLRQKERERRADEARREHDLQFRISSPSAQNPEDISAKREVLAQIEQAIDSLPDSLRSVFVMRDVQELTGAETAESLGIEEGAVRVRLHRARGMMRDWLGEGVESMYWESFEFAGERCDRIVAGTLALLRAS